MIRLFRSLVRAMAVLAGIAVVAAMLSFTALVLHRNLLGEPITGVVEYNEVLLIVMVFLGIAYTQHMRRHVGVSLLVDRLSPAAARVVEVAGMAISTVLLAWLGWATLDRALSSTEVGEHRIGLVSIALWPLRWLIVLGIVCWLVEMLIQIIERIRDTGAKATVSDDSGLM